MGRINLLVATPGRLLQHMDETPNFDTTNVRILGACGHARPCRRPPRRGLTRAPAPHRHEPPVLDEADRILDLGFEKTLNAILENLPKSRQTLLFSATQTKSVRDLARLSLKVCGARGSPPVPRPHAS